MRLAGNAARFFPSANNKPLMATHGSIIEVIVRPSTHKSRDEFLLGFFCSPSALLRSREISIGHVVRGTEEICNNVRGRDFYSMDMGIILLITIK